jgi:hypothetical protein
METEEMRLDELAHRIRFATFAVGEITLYDAYCTFFDFCANSEWLTRFATPILPQLRLFVKCLYQKIINTYCKAKAFMI